ncbi:MAG: nickel pincer cofactor biosynthesis protein LarB [Coriobacteriia bacterium]|jgi:NCAIR mutase (PurE)-related protein|nr:nickel pincer cofactor biosynthesis protein LarB [Coriobacteriia bacterium]
MDPTQLRRLLDEVAAGSVKVESAVDQLKSLPFSDGPEVKIDHHRALRCGFAEVVFCEGKTAGQVRSAARELLEGGQVLLGTRANASHYQAVAQVASDARFFEQPRLIVVDRRKERPQVGHIVVVSGGTADIPVAEEAAISAEVMGNRVTRVYDVGIAGLHRLLAHQDVLRDARAVIAVAGMEGALPSLVTGLISAPVVAVPTSVGYGASLNGLAALLAMLNSCASGMAVVNIDNGFGAAAIASRVNQTAASDST